MTPASMTPAWDGTDVDVVIPTYRRPGALAVTLTSLTAQSLPRFRVVVSDQAEDGDATAAPEVQTPARLLRMQGRPVELHRHLPRRGLAEHRQYLLDQARARYALFLDDDVLCEPPLLARLRRVLGEQGCGFAGAPLIGLSHVGDVRPHQQAIEPWAGRVEPELVGPHTSAWERHHLHNAANALHVQQRLGATDGHPVPYKIAWVGGCVLYDLAKLRAVGGFSFWRELPERHCGEDVVAQLRVMARFGGCGVLPSGAYHQQLPTTVVYRACNAPGVLPWAECAGPVGGNAVRESRHDHRAGTGRRGG